MGTQNENWLDNILGQFQDTGRIVPDDEAADAVGLSHPDDLELERIVQETIAANWGSESAVEEAPKEDTKTPDATQFFAPPSASDLPEAPAETPQPSVGEVSDEQAAESEAAHVTEEAAPVSEEAAVAEETVVTEEAAVSEEAAASEEITVYKEAAASDDTAGESTGTAGQPAMSDNTMAIELPTTISQPIADENSMENDPMATNQEAPAQVPRKRKPSRRKKEYFKGSKKSSLSGILKEIFNIPHLLVTVVWVVLILFIGTTLGRTVWLCAEDLLALGKTAQQVTITIEEGDSLADISQKLEDAGMIRYANLFKTFASITGKDKGINSGTVTFSGDTVYDYNALIYAMSYDDDPTGTVSVTIPEGYTCKQIFELLEANGVCTVDELEKYAANGELDDYWFLEDVKRGGRYCLEGFLFPDTYEFYVGDTAEHAIEKLLDGFDYRFSDRLKEKFETLNKNYSMNLSLREVITMASIVQKEKATDPEGYTISSVFYNRLRNSASFPFLNSDATALYATEVLGAVTDSQIQASPYNTYTQQGLPPGPICNPGLSSIDAALEPEDTQYFFFVLDKSANAHVFSKTYEEHQRKLRELGLA